MKRFSAALIFTFLLCNFTFAQTSRRPKDTSHDVEIFSGALNTFTNLLKSEARAQKHLARLKRFADDSQFQYETFVRLSQRLLVARIEEEDDLGLIQSSSLAENALAGDDADFAGLALTMADLWESNISARAGAAILIGDGLPVYKLTAEELKVSEDKARRIIDNASLSGKDLATVMRAAFYQNYKFSR
jgi:hypothetical protein